MESVKILIAREMYPSEVLLSAAYKFIDQAYIHFSVSDEYWEVNISKKVTSCDVEKVAKEFENNLISQTLRCIISEKTKTLREIILARALTSTYINDDDPILKIKAEQEDVSDEELEKILTNWFEIYGKQ